MSNFLNLVWNEWLKIVKRKGLYIALIVMTSWIALQVVIFRLIDTLESSDTDVIEITGQFLSIGSHDFVAMMLGAGSLFSIVCMFLLATLIPSEFKYGTIKLLLIRAHSRTKILLSKYIIMIVFIVLLLLFTVTISYISGFIFFNGDSENTFLDILKSMSYTIVYTIIYSTIVFMVSVLTKSSSGTIGFIFALIFMESFIMGFLSRYEFAKYLLYYHRDLSVYEDTGTPALDGLTPGFSAFVIVAYLILMLAISIVTFKKRDIA